MDQPSAVVSRPSSLLSYCYRQNCLSYHTFMRCRRFFTLDSSIRGEEDGEFILEQLLLSPDRQWSPRWCAQYGLIYTGRLVESVA